jgi:hypothetical protein
MRIDKSCTRAGWATAQASLANSSALTLETAEDRILAASGSQHGLFFVAIDRSLIAYLRLTIVCFFEKSSLAAR